MRRPRATVAPAARSSPVLLRIPALRLAAPVGPLGLNPDDTVQVPKESLTARGGTGLGPSPGEMGSAVILGHVDSKTGPAVFYRLSSLRAGNKIAVTLADGVVANFQVDRVRFTYPNEKVPDPRGVRLGRSPTLDLVTCGGPTTIARTPIRPTWSSTAFTVSLTPAGPQRASG